MKIEFIESLSKKKFVKWLRKPYIDNKFIFLDRYSWMHLFSGMTLGYIFIFFYSLFYSLLFTFLLLLSWEIFEMITADILFRKESFIDMIWDLIIGMLGYFIVIFVSLFFVMG
jgi:hypothetical protein